MGRPARLRVDIITDASGVDRGIDKADSKFGKLGGKLGKLGGPAAAALAVVGAAAVGMAVASVKAASDLQQNMGAVETVFGKAAGTVKKFADNAATQVGLSKSEYAGLAASVGTSMQNIGQSQGQAAKSTDKIIARAADLAATFGGTTKDATQALGAAFRGEFDSVERLGISLKASDISAELAARGQAKLTGQALKNAQGQATLDLIMRQTSKTSGAFGRETNTLAHQQQVLGAKFENVKAAIGARLLPILVRLASWVSDRLFPALGRLGPSLTRVGSAGSGVATVYSSYLLPVIRGIQGMFERVSGAVQRNSSSFAKLKPLITGIGRAIQTVAPIVGGAWKLAFETIGTVIGVVIDAIAKLIDIIDSVIRKFDAMASKVSDVVGSVRDKVGGITDLVGKIPGFSLNVSTMTPGGMTGGVGGLGLSPALDGPAGLLTASAGDPLSFLSVFGTARQSASSEGVHISMPVTVTGALDPVSVARQLDKVLRDAAVRLGKLAPAF